MTTIAKPMQTLGITALLGVLAACNTINIAPAIADEQPKDHAVKWSYEGAGAAEHWGDLKPEYGVCSTGTQQSPIDLQPMYSAKMIAPATSWNSFSPIVVNNGHTIQVNVPEGSSMELEGKSFKLLQFHFHHGSEHTIAGKQYPLEVHFVHQAADGGLAVLGVFFEEGAQNETLAKIWNDAPAVKGEIQSQAVIDPSKLLPIDQSRFRYEGSLTTPPCSEVVNWVVFKQPLTASAQQIEAFAKIFAINYRPVQPLNRRFILSD